MDVGELESVALDSMRRIDVLEKRSNEFKMAKKEHEEHRKAQIFDKKCEQCQRFVGKCILAGTSMLKEEAEQ
jgi:hypothetical protein